MANILRATLIATTNGTATTRTFDLACGDAATFFDLVEAMAIVNEVAMITPARPSVGMIYEMIDNLDIVEDVDGAMLLAGIEMPLTIATTLLDMQDALLPAIIGAQRPEFMLELA